MPYKHRAGTDTETSRAASVLASTEPNGLRFELIERHADPGLTQRLECGSYTAEVGGSNPSARTITLTKGKIALVDAEDFLRFGHLKWTTGSFGGRESYAYRSEWRGEKCKTILLHRLIVSALPGQIVDHVNGDTFDNRRANLRFATRAQNRYNARHAKSKYGFVGVDSQTPGSYRGRVAVGGRAYYTKTFSCPILTAIARDLLAQKHHGQFAVLNFKFIPVAR